MVQPKSSLPPVNDVRDRRNALARSTVSPSKYKWCERLLHSHQPLYPPGPTYPPPLLRHGRPGRRKVTLPMHVHVLPPRHARGLRQTLRKSKRERIVCHDALHRHQGAQPPSSHLPSRTFSLLSVHPPLVFSAMCWRGEVMDRWMDVAWTGTSKAFLTCTDASLGDGLGVQDQGFDWQAAGRARRV
jgi:hypothetical protein